MIKTALDTQFKLIYGYYRLTYPTFILKLLSRDFPNNSLSVLSAYPVHANLDKFTEDYFDVSFHGINKVKFVLDGIFYEIMFRTYSSFSTDITINDHAQSIRRVLEQRLRSTVRPPIRKVEVIDSAVISTGAITSDKLSFV